VGFDNVEPRYTVALFTLQKEQITDGEVPIRGPYTDPESYNEGLKEGPTWFPREEAKAWAGSAKFPLLPPAKYSGPAFKHSLLHQGYLRNKNPGEEFPIEKILHIRNHLERM